MWCVCVVDQPQGLMWQWGHNINLTSLYKNRGIAVTFADAKILIQSKVDVIMHSLYMWKLRNEKCLHFWYDWRHVVWHMWWLYYSCSVLHRVLGKCTRTRTHHSKGDFARGPKIHPKSRGSGCLATPCACAQRTGFASPSPRGFRSEKLLKTRLTFLGKGEVSF